MEGSWTDGRRQGSATHHLSDSGQVTLFQVHVRRVRVLHVHWLSDYHLLHLVLPTALWSRHYYHPHCNDEETEGQRGQVRSPRSHRKWRGQPGRARSTPGGPRHPPHSAGVNVSTGSTMLWPRAWHTARRSPFQPSSPHPSNAPHG